MASNDSVQDDANKMFGPLVFENGHPLGPLSTDLEVTCLVCENTFNLALSFEIFVGHLYKVHNLVIEDVQHIHNLPEYIRYWRDKFKEKPMEEIIPSLKDTTSDELYFLLSTLLEEDKQLRHRLRLESVLAIQEFERTDTGYCRMCLFCKLNFEGTRVDFVAHLENQHNLQLGNPQNLVYIEQMVEKIAETLDKLTCIFCERVFPERNVLKEHMRKKLHKRLNRYNTEYDKFFMINYLEPDKKGRSMQRESDEFYDGPVNSDGEYEDWKEKEDQITCLLCEKRETNINTLCLHMEADHDFDFADFTKDFDFYQKIKLVNYVRHQVHNKKCLYCDKVCESKGELQTHLYEEQHCKIPELKIFEHPEFFFPTYENDTFLYLIEDIEDC